jgi:hypothetical protein
LPIPLSVSRAHLPSSYPSFGKNSLALSLTAAAAPAPIIPPIPPKQRDARLRCEVVAHSRWLSALDIHPRRDAFAAAAEDCTVSAWTLPVEACGGGGGGVAAAVGAARTAVVPPEPLLSAAAVNSVLTGVAWCGEGCDDVVAAACDADELLIWRGAGSAAAGGGGARWRP